MISFTKEQIEAATSKTDLCDKILRDVKEAFENKVLRELELRVVISDSYLLDTLTYIPYKESEEERKAHWRVFYRVM